MSSIVTVWYLVQQVTVPLNLELLVKLGNAYERRMYTQHALPSPLPPGALT